MDMDLYKCAVNAVSKSVLRKGWTVIGQNTDIDLGCSGHYACDINIVALDKDDSLHAIWVMARDGEGEYNFHEVSREIIEQEFILWAQRFGKITQFLDKKVYFDKCTVTVMNSNTAFLKYEYNYLDYEEN